MKRATPKGSLRDAIAAQAKGGRLRLYHWMMDRYAELSAARDELKPTWEQFAKSLAVAGATDAKGNPPTGPAVRRVWLGLEAEMAKPRGAGGARATLPVSGERQPAPLQSSPLPSAVPSNVGVIDPIAPPPVRRRMRFQSARALAPGEAPKDDGSKLPRPLHPSLKIED
jgi:hypothetical protein